MAQIGLIVLGAALCLILDGGVIELLVKPFVERLRPINDPSLKQLLDIVPGTYENSFLFCTCCEYLFYCNILLIVDKEQTLHFLYTSLVIC